MIYKKKKNNNILIKNNYNISDKFFNILINRGYDTDEKITSFLYPSFNMLLNPFLFNNMQFVVDKINEYITSGRNIFIYSCCDIDGACAVSMLYLTLRMKGVTVSYCFDDKNLLQQFENSNHSYLLINIGCNSISSEKADIINVNRYPTFFNNLTLNPKSNEENYPFKDLCLTGIVAKLIHGLCGIDYMKKFLDLIAIATISSQVPLVEENRIFVSKGLEFINYMKRPGIKGFEQYIQTSNDIKVNDLNKYISLFNAVKENGRIQDIVTLMTTADSSIIMNLCNNFYVCHENYKNFQQNIFENCVSLLGEEKRKSLVLWDNNWNIYTLKYLSNKLSDKYNCPVVLLTYSNDNQCYCGVAKSFNNINIFDILQNSILYLKNFNGKNNFFNLQVGIENLDNFKSCFSSLCEKLDDSLFEKCIEYDSEIEISSITKEFINEINLVEPCGVGNPKIKLLVNNISMKNVMVRGDRQEHFSSHIFDETGICDSICFNQKIPEYFDNLDIIGSVSLNKYNENEKISFNIESIKKSETVKNNVSSTTQYGIRTVDQPIEILGLSAQKNTQFKNNGINTVHDLINYFPKKYLDFRVCKKVKDIGCQSELCSMIGTITKLKQGEKISYAMCVDEDGQTFMAAWFHQDYVLRLLTVGYKFIFCGPAKKNDTGFVQIYPKYFGSDISKYRTIIPEYKKIKGMSIEYLTEAINKALDLTANTDFLDKFIVDKFNLLSDYDATRKLHHPRNDFEIRDGQKRKVFNDLFKFNFILKSKNNVNDKSNFVLSKNDKWDELRNLLPYQLTNDQNKCLYGLYEYMKSGKILNALVQGDVGSGKTMVGLFSMLLAANNGFQSCIIAPTEVLAKQHYDEISGYMKQLGYNVGYLVGGLKAKERKAVLKGLEDGSIQMVVGTHAIIQDTVKFNNLALVVIDEQHRFGVSQREKLAELDGPHMLSMSATPIPRTLSMAIYGDNIQVYSIKEKPAGRKEIITLRKDNDDEINMFMLQQIREGRQCYVVCPLIEDSESEAMADVHSVKQEVDNLFSFFKNYPEVKISNTTGRMKKELIAEEINKFATNQTNILVSTTIIEVGVNVPNATVMVLKSSERFGLAQAHQLRGRVGRGRFQSYCILQTSKDDPKAEILCNNNDGFEIAKQDLLLRGAGDFIGTQQTGNNRNVMLMMSEPELYKSIAELNDEIYANSSLFAKYSYLLEIDENK